MNAGKCNTLYDGAQMRIGIAYWDLTRCFVGDWLTSVRFGVVATGDPLKIRSGDTRWRENESASPRASNECCLHRAVFTFTGCCTTYCSWMSAQVSHC